ncbi:MAG: membrane-associated oxidoreductase [Pseudomonadota bacterium]
MSTVTHLPHGRSLADFEPLGSAEEKLRDGCWAGEIALVDENCPGAENDENTIRAEVLRFFLLGGSDDAAVHERGVQLYGAFITGVLDLNGAVLPHGASIRFCSFTEVILLGHAHIEGSLYLSGSRVPGIIADGLVAKGDVFLTEDFRSTGEIRLLGGTIDGDLCCQGDFEVDDGDVLSVDRVVIKGGFFLNDGFKAAGTVRLHSANVGGSVNFEGAKITAKKGPAVVADGSVINGYLNLTGGFSAVGAVRLMGAEIGGDFNCRGGSFVNNQTDALCLDAATIKGNIFFDVNFSATGVVRLLRVRVGCDLYCQGGDFNSPNGGHISADGMIVEGGFFFRKIKNSVENVSLASARVGQLVDDENSWGGHLTLDGFQYHEISGGAPTSGSARLRWLDKQMKGHTGLSAQGQDFRPQPWRQLQKVLREMGHAEDARQIAIAFESRLRTAGKIGTSPPHWNRIRSWGYRKIARGFHRGFWLLAGYGYRPVRLLSWFVCVWLICAGFYWFFALPPQAVFAPTNPLVFQNPVYEDCVPGSAEARSSAVSGAGNWYLCEKLREEYTGFSPLAFSLDVILPFVNLRQEEAWGPLTPTPNKDPVIEFLTFQWKHVARIIIWFETIFGWVASLLLAAIVSGLAKRPED